MSNSIVYFQTFTFEDLNLRWVKANIFFRQKIIVLPVYLYAKLVSGRGFVVSLHLMQRCKANDSNCLGEKLVLLAFLLPCCYNLFAYLQFGELCQSVQLHCHWDKLAIAENREITIPENNKIYKLEMNEKDESLRQTYLIFPLMLIEVVVLASGSLLTGASGSSLKLNPLIVTY